MTSTDKPLLTEVEKLLQNRFDPAAPVSGVPSNALPSKEGRGVKALTLDDNVRGRMPFTKDKFLVKENPELVEWEREVRKFLRRLSPSHGHRVSAVMIYEWATGVKVRDLMAEGGSANRHLRKINQCLRFYFGNKSYMTWIAGRKVPNCYRVPPGWYVKRHRPMTLTLYSEYCEKTLNP